MKPNDEVIETLKKEVDALQVEVMGQKPVWYKNISVWVSILALLFSFGTTIVSYEHTKLQDIQALKSELRTILQRLSELPTEHFEYSKKYIEDANALGFISSQLNQEATLLAKQAASISRRIPSELITSTEYFSIGLALQNSYQNNDAIEYYDLARKSSESINDEVAAVRGTANLRFITAQPEDGREKFREALSLFENYPGFNDYTKISTHVWTYLYWARAEASIGEFDIAKQKVDSAASLIEGLLPSPGKQTLNQQIAQTWNELNISHIRQSY